MIWREVRLKRGVPPFDFYQSFTEEDGKRVESRHHFWDEPWWPNAYVVRVQASAEVSLEERPDVDHVVVWDATDDEERYGDAWRPVSTFFHSASSMACVMYDDPHSTDQFRRKMIHCFLNAQGMSQRDEAWFAWRLFWNRATINLRWRLYLRRRWEQQQRTKVAA